MARIPIESMSLEEKLEAMELLWDDLCNRAEEVRSPEWHKEVLEERAAAVARGEAEYEDWEDAKERLKRELL